MALVLGPDPRGRPVLMPASILDHPTNLIISYAQVLRRMHGAFGTRLVLSRRRVMGKRKICAYCPFGREGAPRVARARQSRDSPGGDEIIESERRRATLGRFPG